MKKRMRIQVKKNSFFGKEKILEGTIIETIRYVGEDWLGDEINEIWYKVKLDNDKTIKIHEHDTKYTIIKIMDKVA